MLSIEWEADLMGGVELMASLDRMYDAFGSFKVPLKKSAAIVAVSIGTGMLQGGTPDAFPPLATSTLYSTARYRMGGPLLLHGLLLAAVTDLTGERSGSAYALTDDTATVGLDPETEQGQIGVWMTEGNEEQHRPARVFVRVLPGDIENILGTFDDYIEYATTRAFIASRG